MKVDWFLSVLKGPDYGLLLLILLDFGFAIVQYSVS
jgi:hypothetical protein